MAVPDGHCAPCFRAVDMREAGYALFALERAGSAAVSVSVGLYVGLAAGAEDDVGLRSFGGGAGGPNRPGIAAGTAVATATARVGVGSGYTTFDDCGFGGLDSAVTVIVPVL